MAQDLLVIGRGAMIYEGTVDQFMSGAARSWVTVRSPQVEAIAAALEAEGAQITRTGPDAIDVVGPDCSYVGELAARQQAVLHELSPQRGSLEEAFLQVTSGAREFKAEAGDDGEAAR